MTLAALYSAHHPYVRGVVRKLGASELDVDDLTQEVFCVLLRRPLANTEARGVRRWLYQTARRVVGNHRRGRRRELLRLAHAWEPIAPPCPEAEAMCGEARGRLARTVTALPSEARALYRLSEVEGLPGPAVAERLGLNVDTAYARIRALRRRLALAVMGRAAKAVLLVVLALAAILLLQAGCAAEGSSSLVSRAPSSREASDEHVVAGRAALRGPALGLAGAAARR